MRGPTEYDQEWFKKSYSRLFSDKENDWLFYKRTAEFAGGNLDRKSLVLEVGCGLGGLSYRLSFYGGGIVSIDISEYACRRAKSTYESAQIKFTVADAQYLPFKSEIFDGVIVSHLFEHLTDLEAANVQREIYRVLKTGAALTVEQPVCLDESIIDVVLLCLFSSHKNKELYYYTKKALRAAQKINPKTDFHHLSGIGNPTHRRVYDISLLVDELKAAGFGEFQFYRRKIFRILFFNSMNLFRLYTQFYLALPRMLRRILCISPDSLVKVVKP
ncbi:MAG: methyltransferase domain-containing protein [Candidatus Omnitrophota bacterium]|nr:methyltransferase domain-containing protein [Candidatus Omnitrophota bacterium]